MDAALNWTLEHADELESNAFRNLGRRLADMDLDRAMSMLDQLGPLQREGWMDGVVSQMAQTDLDRAVQFVDSYRGQPGYETAAGRLVQEMVEMFPDIAGVELDAMRSPFFFRPDEGREKGALMTGLVRQVRGDLDAAARRTGHDRYVLRVNVPRS